MEPKRVRRLYDQVIENRKNCAFEDVENLLLAVGFVVRKNSGSHVVFKRGQLAISVPKRKPVKVTYIDQVLDLIGDVLGE